MTWYQAAEEHRRETQHWEHRWAGSTREEERAHRGWMHSSTDCQRKVNIELLFCKTVSRPRCSVLVCLCLIKFVCYLYRCHVMAACVSMRSGPPRAEQNLTDSHHCVTIHCSHCCFIISRLHQIDLLATRYMPLLLKLINLPCVWHLSLIRLRGSATDASDTSKKLPAQQTLPLLLATRDTSYTISNVRLACSDLK